MDWRFVEYTHEKDEILEQWQKIYDDQPSSPAANRPEFILPLLARTSAEKKLYLLIGSINNKVLSILPITVNIRRRHFIKWRELGFLYHSHLWLHSFPLIDINDIELNWQKIVKQAELLPLKWSKFVLRNLQLDNTPDDYCNNFVALFKTDDTKTVKDIISKKLLKNILRLRKKTAAELGKHETVIFNNDSLDAGYKRYIEVDNKGWKVEKNVGISGHDDINSFYIDTIKNRTDCFHPFISVLAIGDNDIAGAFGYYSGNCIYLHSINFDTEFSHLSPGSQLLHDILEYACTVAEIVEVNLVTDPAWVQRWHPDKRCIINKSYYRRSLKGNLLKFTFIMFSRVKQFIKSRL